MNKLQGALFSTAVDYLTFYIKNEKTFVLEPLTCMIRLAMLSFKPNGAKICVYENSIYIQEPSILQGPIRWISGDNRNDIHYLLEPITKALQKYAHKNNNSLKNIYTLALDGLKKLKKSYIKKTHNSSLTTHSIDLYISKIKESLTNEEKNNNNNILLDNDDSNNKTYESLIMLWTDEQIDIINTLFQQCQKNTDNKSYLYAIDNIINSKIKFSKEILVKSINNIL